MPAELFAVPAGSGAVALLATPDAGAPDSGKGSGVASARKKRDASSYSVASCAGHVRRGATEAFVPQAVWNALRYELYKTTFSQHLDGGGAVDGYTLTNIGPCFEELGFDDDDLVQQVNGIDLSTSDAYVRMYESIQQQGGAYVRLLRGGVPLELRYRVQF